MVTSWWSAPSQQFAVRQTGHIGFAPCGNSLDELHRTTSIVGLGAMFLEPERTSATCPTCGLGGGEEQAETSRLLTPAATLVLASLVPSRNADKRSRRQCLGSITEGQNKGYQGQQHKHRAYEVSYGDVMLFQCCADGGDNSTAPSSTELSSADFDSPNRRSCWECTKTTQNEAHRTL